MQVRRHKQPPHLQTPVGLSNRRAFCCAAANAQVLLCWARLGLHLAEYREAILKTGEMMVADPAELIDLTEAAQSTMDIYADQRQQKKLAG